MSKTWLCIAILIIWRCAGNKKGLQEEWTVTPESQTVVEETDTLTTEEPFLEVIDSAEIDLSTEEKLLLAACNNYLKVIQDNEKIPDVLLEKAAIYFNKKHFAEARTIYQELVERFPKVPQTVEAVKFIAEGYVQQGNNREAYAWYDKLSKLASDTTLVGKEALERKIAVRFRIAKELENEGQTIAAAQAYERIGLDFKDSRFSDMAIYNAGLLYEKSKNLKKAIFQFVSMAEKYPKSKYVPKALNRTAQNYENLENWEKAASIYLELGKRYPTHKLTEDAYYNAGLCYNKLRLSVRGEKEIEKLEKVNFKKFKVYSIKAASVFEQLAEKFPNSKDAPNVLFKAGEIYGELKDWSNVARINQLFTKRYGNEKDRIIQAMCMVGVASFMQKKYDQALKEFGRVLRSYKKLNIANNTNDYYAAQAQFMIAQIFQKRLNQIELKLPESAKQKSLNKKKELLKVALNYYRGVLTYNITEWTTKATYYMGRTLEDFGIAVFNQERKAAKDFNQLIEAELKIADALKQTFVDKALPYYELNVKMAIREKIDDIWTKRSRKKVCNLPYLVGKNYSDILNRVKKKKTEKRMNYAEKIKYKLDLLQSIAPYQNEAIDMYLKSLELASRYLIKDKAVEKAKRMISFTTYTVGEIFYELVQIAKAAPVPENFDNYEAFLFKNNLLSQIEEYENEAINAFYKNIQIGKAYGIHDEWIQLSKESVAELLYQKAKAYETLALNALDNPPFPRHVSENEKIEYRFQFEELGFKLQEVAWEFYQEIMAGQKAGRAVGIYVNYAYLKLYYENEAQYGARQKKRSVTWILSDSTVSSSVKKESGWEEINFDAQDWLPSTARVFNDLGDLSSFNEAKVIWANNAHGSPDSLPADERYFRKQIYIQGEPVKGILRFNTFGELKAYFNAHMVYPDEHLGFYNPGEAFTLDISEYLRKGKNVLAFKAGAKDNINPGVIFDFQLIENRDKFFPVLPGDSLQISEKIIESFRKTESIAIRSWTGKRREAILQAARSETELGRADKKSAASPAPAVVVAKKAVMRSGPGNKFKKKGEIKKGEQLLILKEKNKLKKFSISLYLNYFAEPILSNYYQSN